MPFLALFHATLNALPPVVAALQRLAPDTPVRHYADEGLLARKREGASTEQLWPRFAHWMETVGSDRPAAILMTCSTFTPLAPRLRKLVSCPLIAIDDAMLDRALAAGPRLGIVATVATAAPTTEKLLRERTVDELTVRIQVCEEAFAALSAGDTATHDRKVRTAIAALATSCDAVILAQVSMARVVRSDDTWPVPVLSSADSAVHATLAAAGLAKPPFS